MLSFIVVASTLGQAHAYDQPVHEYLSRRAFAGPKAFGDSPANAQAAVELLRLRIYRAGAETPSLKDRFLRRFPTVKDFDEAAFKRFFFLNPQKQVAGFDSTPLPVGTPLEVYTLASRLPDDDTRNRDRVRSGADGGRSVDPYGQPIPEDPAILDMGKATGTSSQAHAHYQLPPLQFSDSPDVLKSEPRRFATPPDIHTFGTELAESYAALSLLAAQLPHGTRLSMVHAGATAHHLEDVANQIHTVQVGIYDFFFDAKLASILEELRSVGGLRRPRPDFISIGIQIISNHHLLVEALFRKHLLAEGDPVAALAATRQTDAPFVTELSGAPRGCSEPFTRALMTSLVELSSHEGPAVYTAIRSVALPKLSRAGGRFEETEDPDLFLRPNADLTEFYALELRGTGRAEIALGAWWDRYNACQKLTPSVERAVAEQLVRRRLDSMDALDVRAKAYVPKPPLVLQTNWWVPGGYGGAVVFFALLMTRRRRKKAAAAKK